MSISSILSPDDEGDRASACSSSAVSPPSSSSTSLSTSCGSAGGESTASSSNTSSSSATKTSSGATFTWNEDPEKIDAMLRSLNPYSPEWVIWKDWADFLAEERNANQKVKGFILDELMRKVYELLGSTPSGSPKSSLSPGSNLDDYDEQYRHNPAVDLDDSTEVGFYHCQGGSTQPSGDQSRSQTTRPGSQDISNTADRSLSSFGNKRKRGTGGSTSEGEDDENGKKRKENPRPLKSIRNGPRFSCPFYKKSPEVHGKNASCLWPGFGGISRLKEHLYRVHTRLGLTATITLQPIRQSKDMTGISASIYPT
ncbi:uncharacterized protein LTHEOB_8097 [Lasiodiplodia theobromae]|uniref:uncharacterized protein n=1 Tax=Lasiodiplodia theobromae TaxID=45133 RepID=UPI0015C3BFDB|nr:uncharacterized protein LTHEOB_8097 [Lasiodiplodia theobromae]KAF4541943.1 hypothetical protein LTHEOB_8097 [Lasiodiplodia theobromae]